MKYNFAALVTCLGRFDWARDFSITQNNEKKVKLSNNNLGHNIDVNSADIMIRRYALRIEISRYVL